MKILKYIFLLFFIQAAYGEIYRTTDRDGDIIIKNRTESGISSKAKFSNIFDDIIEKVSSESGIDSKLVKCIIKVESDFNPKAVSRSGAMGLMQLMPDTAKYYRLDNAFDPEQNIRAGTRHFRYLLDHLNSDIPAALAAYHAGLSRVKKSEGMPPIKATIDYVNLVMKYYAGNGEYSSSVKKLYKRIEKDGTIAIFSN